MMKMDRVQDPDRFMAFIDRRAREIAQTHQRNRSSLVKILGEYFWKKMPDSKFRSAQIITRLDNLHTDADLTQFLEKEQTIRDPLTCLQYKFFFVPDFSESQSVLIFKQHHCFCDGIATLVLTCGMTKSYNPDQFSRLAPPMSLCDRFMKYATLPMTMTMAYFSLFAHRDGENEVANNFSKLTGQRKIAFTKPLSIEHAFDKAKRHGSSLTDLILSTVTLTFGELVRSQNQVQVSMPFTLRGFPRNFKKLKVNNDFAVLPKLLSFPVDAQNSRIELFQSDQVFRETLLTKMAQTNADMRSVKSKFTALGWYFMMKYFMFLLRVPMVVSPWTVANTYTSVVSVVPGKKEPFVFDMENAGREGVTVHSVAYFVPGSGRLANGVSVITHGKELSLAILADTSYWEQDQHKRFCETFERIFEKSMQVL